MTIQEYVKAMPKVDLHTHLEGMMRPETLQMIADQNETARMVTDFESWMQLLESPTNARLGELIRTASSWLHEAEDLTRIVYDLGVELAKQNVRYAEVSVNPALYLEHLALEQILAALNDGRDRVQRGWQIELAWILTLPRDEPRRADEIARWVTSASGRKTEIVALGLSGPDDVQPIGQFERAFKMAEKNFIAQAPHVEKAVNIPELLETLNPDCLLDGWGLYAMPEIMQLLLERRIALHISMVNALRSGQIGSYKEYPLRSLYDEGLILTIGSDMGRLHGSTLTEQYLQAVESCDLSIEELEDIGLNAIRSSRLSDEEKSRMEDEFQNIYESLRDEYLVEVDTL